MLLAQETILGGNIFRGGDDIGQGLQGSTCKLTANQESKLFTGLQRAHTFKDNLLQLNNPSRLLPVLRL